MKPRQIEGWTISCFTTLRRSQQKTLAAIVFGALRVKHVSLAALGRSMDRVTKAKHRIKRVDSNLVHVGKYFAGKRLEKS